MNSAFNQLSPEVEETIRLIEERLAYVSATNEHDAETATSEEENPFDVIAVTRQGDDNEINPFNSFVVTRQDERQVSFILDDDKKIDWEVSHAGECYLLVVKNPFEVTFDGGHEITYHNGHVVGVYYDRDTAYDAAKSMEESGIVPYAEISAFDYLEVEGKMENPEQADELKDVAALHYINNGEPIE